MTSFLVLHHEKS
jgi:hypothetical protein